LGSFYERYDWDWSDFGGSLKMLDINPGDIVTILKTSKKDEHVGQTILLRDGQTKVVYYRVGTFFDMNEGTLGDIDLTIKNYYYDVLEG
jgi:hypothetical protein